MNTENIAQSGNKKWGREMIQQISQFEDWKIAITIPVNMEIEAEHKILNLDEAISYLDGAKDIYKLDCICRTMMGNCDSPKETCVAWDSAKALLDTDIYKNQNARLITKEEAIETLKMSHDSGLVHMAYAMWDDKVNRICSCCSCCCAVFSSVLDYSMFPELITSEMISVTDINVCGSCGTCVDRCQFEAREMIDGTLTMNIDLCYGCGVCVTTCPNDAIILVKKS
jgi:NAD-dependent dihydropyrimidine dehydrogenase PreA subunit